MGKKIVFLLASFFFVWVANGQNTIIKGIVTDSITGERLPYVSLKFEGTTIGAATDGDGNFSFSTPTIDKILEISYLGYDKKQMKVIPGKTNDLKIQLVPNGIMLNDVVVRPQKEKYSKKENPAVTFVRQVIALRESNDPHNHDYFQYDRYEKMVFAMNEYESLKRMASQASSISWPILSIRLILAPPSCRFQRKRKSRRSITVRTQSLRNI